MRCRRVGVWTAPQPFRAHARVAVENRSALADRLDKRAADPLSRLVPAPVPGRVKHSAGARKMGATPCLDWTFADSCYLRSSRRLRADADSGPSRTLSLHRGRHRPLAADDFRRVPIACAALSLGGASRRLPPRDASAAGIPDGSGPSDCSPSFSVSFASLTRRRACAARRHQARSPSGRGIPESKRNFVTPSFIDGCHIARSAAPGESRVCKNCSPSTDPGGQRK